MVMYVLVEVDESDTRFVLGVFDSPNVDDKLPLYFGGDMEVVKTTTFHDSGFEWEKVVKWGGVCTSKLVMHYFTVNDI